MLFNSLEKLKQILPNCVNYKNKPIAGIQFDSRKIKEGELFVALKDIRDGHDFVNSAVENGACACLVEREFSDLDIPQFVVEDSWKGLHKIGNEARKVYNGKVISVTGSSGKTTVSNMIKSCLENSYSTYKNYNGLLGLPVTLAHMDQTSDFAVLELGSDNIGNINILTNLAKPDVAIVTSIGPAHLENFKTIDNIIDEKLSIANGLSENGILIVPHDLKAKATAITNKRVLSISLTDSQADCFAESISEDKIIAKINNKEMEFKPSDISEHRVFNSILTLCVMDCLGFNIEDKKHKVENFKAIAGRGERTELKNNMLLIDESYNANPLSMQKSLETFEKGKSENKTAIIADMLELGENEIELHKSMLTYCKKVKTVYTVGTLMKHLHEELIKNNIHTKHFESADNVIEFLKEQSLSDCEFLIKGSNGMKVYNVVEYLKEEYKK
ncbi:MAG: UDP-N-acetylmuramoyl-tripeptide--D-alanyl-D-alanine ligase [Proteobacteria bacterium]|nr:UDP-N-acetylmuramoyl-tripeptide--D-alanyl-D-alanine ligase [Pseudomonadota bacterium]